MKTAWSKTWKRSIQPRKQRKYRYNAPLHLMQKLMTCILSKDLRKKYNRKNIILKTGDKVKILRGQFKKKTGKVTEVDLKNTKVYIEGIEHLKKDGSKAPYPLNPTNLMITELNMEDRKRKDKLEKQTKTAEKKTTKEVKE
jgi:large subunit ribosomal protein L24